MQRHHDLGGQPAGPMDLADHEAEPWAKTLTAILVALRLNGIGSIDEMRRNMEDLPPEDYDRPYFERWAEAARNLFAEKGLTTGAEIDERMARIKAENEAGR